jgi:rhodanese-related sulfurtransferase
MLKNKGYTNVLALKGGFNEWLAANYPAEPK